MRCFNDTERKTENNATEKCDEARDDEEPEPPSMARDATQLEHPLIPHVGGRRCNLAWHHPRLERLLKDAVYRGWKMEVSANSDEHRGRCGGGVPSTEVFGTKGGLTGVLPEKLDRPSVAKALRARRIFATTGERLVALVLTKDGKLQGDDVTV
ncbi:hypothetical protein F5Y03DRAFT_96130 [Xylaria venustula]|nr:hypothetical protein F5Y03DRAFT_96130 [Xylaria venustula]